jgi:hypothetical protein
MHVLEDGFGVTGGMRLGVAASFELRAASNAFGGRLGVPMSNKKYQMSI